MRLYDDFRRPLCKGDLVIHPDTGYIGFVLDVDKADMSASVFILNKIRQLFIGSISRIKDGP